MSVVGNKILGCKGRKFGYKWKTSRITLSVFKKRFRLLRRLTLIDKLGEEI